MTVPERQAAPARSVERRALAGSVASAVSFVSNLAAALLLVPVLLEAWGAERYGLWLALQSLFTLLTTLDTGHHTFVGNELLRLYPTDRSAARSMLAAGLLGAVLLGGLELLALAVLAFGGQLPWALGQSERALPTEALPAFVLLMLGWVVQGSAGGVWARIYPAAGEYARSVWWGSAYRALQALVIAAAVWLGAGLFMAVAASTAMTLVYAVFSFFDVRSRYRELYPFWRGARASLALRNVAHSMVVTGCALAIQLQQHGVIFLISSRVGLGLVPAFTTTRTLANVFLQAAAIVTGPLVPEMVRLHALREHGKLSDMVRAIWLVTTLPVNLGICLGLPFFEPLYRAWTGGAMAFDARLFAGLALAISLRCLGAPLTALLGGINALGAQVWLALAQSALVIGGLWVWLPEAGLAAAGAALALGELFGSVLLPIVWMRRLQPGVMQGLPLRTLATCALPTAVVGLAVAGLARGLPALLVMGVALAVSGLLYSLQWSELGRPMQRRLLALVRLRASTEQA